MTVALALSAHFTDLPKGVGESAPSAPSTGPTAFASFDGLLAEVSQELLAENPDLNASITKESQRFLPEKPTVVGEPTVVAADAVEHLTSSESTGSAGMVGDFTRQNEPVATLEQADSRPSETVFSPDTAALVELDDARHVFMASIQWTPPPRTSVQPAAAADAPKDDAREQISSAAPQFSLDPALTRVTESMYVPPVELSAQGVPSSADASGAATTIASDAETFDVRVAGFAAVEPVRSSRIVQVSQALVPTSVEESMAHDVAFDDLESDGSVEVQHDLDAPVPLKRVDPIQQRTLDAMPLAEPVLVSVDTLESMDTNTSVDTSIPVDTPELPVAALDLDVVRVDIDDDLAVEVRTVDGEVDVALLGADAVKPVMKGVQAELRESLKRGGYDLGQFERSEQDQAERRHRRRQHKHQERRDSRRGALL